MRIIISPAKKMNTAADNLPYESLPQFLNEAKVLLYCLQGMDYAGLKDIYASWGNKLARQLCSETDFILNLASKEYSKAVSAHLPESIRFLTCTFGERKGGKVIEKGTLCKMARGEMVRWLAEHHITEPEDIKGFDRLGYTYCEDFSNYVKFVFIKGGNQNVASR